MLKRFLISAILNCFLINTIPYQAFAQSPADLGLPAPGAMVATSPAYTPLMVRGLKVHPENPFLFDFIVDTGNSQLKVGTSELNEKAQEQIKYFLAALTVPVKDLWVNLSPYEGNRIAPESLGGTLLGRDMLAQDYLLKQMTASLVYPEKELGRKFWDDVYTQAKNKYGDVQIPRSAFNKVWVVADKAKVFVKNNTVVVVDSHIKVMLEEDYVALNKNIKSATSRSDSEGTTLKQITAEIILPALEREVNEGKNFAQLRQMYQALILAAWYKKELKQSLLNQVYANQAKVNGVKVDDPTIKDQIYQQYLKAYKKGVFNLIKEDGSSDRQARKYFAGGVVGDVVPEVVTEQEARVKVGKAGDLAMITINADPVKSAIIPEPMDEAMIAERTVNGVNVKTLESISDVNQYVAQQMIDQLEANYRAGKNTVMILPTGGTFEGVYAAFVKMLEGKPSDFLKGWITFNMDEYYPGAAYEGNWQQNPQSYRAFMEEHLFRHIRQYGLQYTQLNFLNGQAQDIEAEVKRYETALDDVIKKNGGVLNLAMGGIGRDGHVAFNEPKITLDANFLAKWNRGDGDLLNQIASFNEFEIGADIQPNQLRQALVIVLSNRMTQRRSVQFRDKMRADIMRMMNKEASWSEADEKQFDKFHQAFVNQPVRIYRGSFSPEQIQKAIRAVKVTHRDVGEVLLMENDPANGLTASVDLAYPTIIDNLRFFKEIKDMPLKALSIGVGTLKKAKKVLIVATKKVKQEAVEKTIAEPSAAVTASLLQGHPDFNLITDSEAAPGTAMTVEQRGALISHVMNALLDGRESGRHLINTFMNNAPVLADGWVVGVDASGSTLREVIVEIKGGKVVQMINSDPLKWDDGGYKQLGDIFQLMAVRIKALKVKAIEKGMSADAQLRIGLSFAFRMKQTGLIEAKVTLLAKGWQARIDYMDQNPAQLLQQALDNELSNAKVLALMNDTTATQLNVPGAIMAIILGTGFNISVFDSITAQILNGESGGINIPDFILTNADRKFIEFLKSQGQWNNQYERFITSESLAQLIRITLAEDKYGSVFKAKLDDPDNFKGKSKSGRDRFAIISQIEQAGSLENWSLMRSLFADMFNMEESLAQSMLPDTEAKRVYQTIKMLTDRSANLVAASIAANAGIVDEEYAVLTGKGYLIPVDGSVFWKYFNMKERIASSLEGMVGNDPNIVFYEGDLNNIPRSANQITFVYVNTASARGAAISVADKAMQGQVTKVPGGIDFNSDRLALSQSGEVINWQLDPVMMAAFNRGDFTGLTPRIIKVVAINSLLPVLGINP